MKQYLFLLLSVAGLATSAQTAIGLDQQALKQWSIGTANFSGITKIDDTRYAVVSDKEPRDGFFLFHIYQDPQSGEISSVSLEGFKGNPHPATDGDGNSLRDCEGIAYRPSSKTFFISGEGDQKVLEYDMNGTPTGKQLDIPAIFSASKIVTNGGFEALTYNPKTRKFWTTTENTLRADGATASPNHPGVVNRLRLQSFNDDLQAGAQYAYKMDAGRQQGFGRYYAMGVPALCALDDGRLIVMERELNIPKAYVGGEAIIKLYLVNPVQVLPISEQQNMEKLPETYFLPKRLLLTFKTRIMPWKLDYANYEGMCLGAKLQDGRQTLLLINDSQASAGEGPYRLKDYLKVVAISFD